MSQIRQQLLEYQETLDREPGINTLDMMKLPPVVRQILRWTMRSREMSYQALQKAAAELPENKRITRENLDDALAALVEIGWLATESRDGETVYRPSFGAKAGLSPSYKAEAARAKSSGSLWTRILRFFGISR